MQNIIVYGAGGHGKVIVDAIEQEGTYNVLGFLDDSAKSDCYGYPILGGKEYLDQIKTENLFAIVAIGNPSARKEVIEMLTDAGCTLATVIHPTAYVARSAILKAGVVVLPQAVIGVDTTVGKGCIINTAATIDHDCTLEEYVHIAPGAHLAGNIHVRHATHIGIGSSVKEGVSIGADCMVGAGSVVVHDIEDNSVAYGSPAERVRSNND